MRLLAGFVLLLLSTPVWAGDVFRFTIDRDGPLARPVKGRVLVEGSSYRVELDRLGDGPRALDVIVSRDGGMLETSIDLERRTYFEFKGYTRGAGSRLFSLFPGVASKTSTVSNVQLQAAGGNEPEMVSGLAARRHEIRLSYDVAVKFPAETVRGKVTLHATYWLAAGKETTLPRMLRPAIWTDLPEIDGRLAEAHASLRGLPVKQQVSITAEVEQGVTQSESWTTTIYDLATAATRPSLFEVPKGFTYKEPEAVAPGRLVPPK